MMIVINLTIHIHEPVQVQHPAPDVNRLLIDRRPVDWQNMHEAHCTICNDWTQWYHTQARARMGLAGHQSWCRRRTCSK